MKILLSLLLAVAILAGCSFGRPAVERQSFLLQPQRPGPAPGSAGNGSALKIGRIDVAAPFDGRPFVYRRDEQRFETDFYNEFAADPGTMVADAAADWLRRSGHFREVLAARSAGSAELRLEGEVTAFYVDFRAAPTAILALRWQVLRGDVPVAEAACEEAVPLSARTPAAAAQAQQEALARSLARLESVLAKLGR